MQFTKNGEKMIKISRIMICFVVAGIMFSVHARAENYEVGSVVAAEESKIETEVLAKTSNSWNGAVLPEYASGQSEVTILRIKIPPGVKLPLHIHPVINAGVLLKGELTVITDSGDRLDLKEGEAIVEVVDTWHYGYNEGEDTAEIVVFYAGAEGLPVTECYDSKV